MKTSRTLSLVSMVALAALAASLALAAETIPSPAVEPIPTPASATAQRLARMWPGREVGVLGHVQGAIADTREDAWAMMARFNKKYGVFDSIKTIMEEQPRFDLPKPAYDFPGTASGLTEVQEDYQTVAQAIDPFKFDPKRDNPENLEMMLGSLWGKRHGHLKQYASDDQAINEQVIVQQITPVGSERLSMGLSTDGSVQRFFVQADDSSLPSVQDAPRPADVPFKPKRVWYGPRVYSSALDVSDEKINMTARAPAPPPKPPVQSFSFPEFRSTGNLTADEEAPITIMQTIRVTRDGATTSNPAPEPTFTPTMTDNLAGVSKRAWII